MVDERTERVVARLQGSTGLRESIATAFAEGRVPPAIAGAISPAAIDAITSGAEPLESVMPASALEAIVQRTGRPPLIVRNDTVELEDLGELPPGTDALIKGVEPAVRSVGRVEFANFRMPWGGTGWVVAATGDERTVATNRHVAKLIAKRVSTGKGVFLRSPISGVQYAMRIDFREEVDSAPDDAIEVQVRDVLYLADDTAADVALLRIAGPDLPSPLPLADDEAVTGDLVALIGYPAFDTRNDLNDQARYFKDLFDIKRFAPGKVMQAISGATVLNHDCTSLGGNSGSPLIRLTDGKVVGLHFSGVYGVENTAVGVRTLAALLRGDRPISVAVLEGAQEGRKDGAHPAAFFAGRDGYDPDFLGSGLSAPWPGLPVEITPDLATPSDGTADRPNELRYTHFGVLFSRSRRQPVMTAVNIDGGHSVRIKREGDQWFADLRIGSELQLGQRDYDDAEIDRGHMVRREDPNWDPAIVPGPDVTSAVASLANDDTFHYTNAAVQHSTLNQGKRLWQGLENYILDNSRTKGFRACVFTGPIARDDDPEIKAGVLAPREFWKVVAMVNADTGKLHATGYVLSQGELIRDLLERRSRTEAMEGFTLGEYRTFQVSIKDLADATGYDLSAYEDADPLAAIDGAQEALDHGEPLFVPLEGLSDIRM